MLHIVMMLVNSHLRFRICVETNNKLQNQRPTEDPIHYEDKLKKLPEGLENHNIIRQNGPTPSDVSIYGTFF